MDGGDEGAQGGGLRRRRDVVGGRIPVRLGTPLGSKSARAGR